MLYLGEDDLHDYANESNDDDEITPEDDEKINQLIPKVKSQLADYTGYNYDDMYNELWDSYLDVNEAVANLKKRFKKKTSTKESKLAALAKRKTLNRSGSDVSATKADKEPSSISILDNLNLKKRESGSGLSGLNLNKSKSNLPQPKEPPPPAGGAVSSGSKLSKLAALRLAKAKGGAKSLGKDATKGETPVLKEPVIKTPKKEQATKQLSEQKRAAKRPQKTEALETTPVLKPKAIPKTFNGSKLPIFTQFHVKHSLLKKDAHSSLSIITVDSSTENEISRKAQKYSDYLQGVYLPVTQVKTNNELIVANAGKIKGNFKKPSPDDVILKAQNTQDTTSLKKTETDNVEDVTVGIGNLKLPPKLTKPKKNLDLSKVLAGSELKPNLSFAVIGHVDAGKSTLMGMFLKSLNKVDKQFLKKLEEESSKMGKKSFALAWILDQTTEERSRGVTVDICTTAVNTDKANFIIIDAPGHKDYVPRMISGVAQADVGLLIIDANYDGFESGFSYDGQTKEHALLSYCLGLKKLVIVLNKLDMIGYNEERYKDIKLRLEEYLTRSVGFDAAQLVFVPVSGIDGTNVVKKPTDKALTQWYGNSEPTLLEMLEEEAVQLMQDNKNSEQSASTALNEKFMFQVADVNTDFHQASEFALVGRVNSGAIQPGESVSISPGAIYLQVDSIRASESTSGKEIEVYKEKDYALKYDNNVSLVFKEKKAKEELKSNVDLIKPGDLVSNVDNLIPPTTKFTCEIKLFDLRGYPLLPGAKVILHSGGNERPVEFTKFISVLSDSGTAKKKKKILHLGSYKRVVVEVELIDESSRSPRPLPLVTYQQDSRLGRVVFRRDGITIGAGKVLEIL